MPAGTDVVTWSPAVGIAGDDRYTWPEDHVLECGDSTEYSTIPTPAEVIAGVGMNQIIGEIRRRYYDLFWKAPANAALVVDGDYLKTGTKASSFWQALRIAVDSIRAWELQSAYSWPAAYPVSGEPISTDFRDWVLALRKALALDHIRVYPRKLAIMSYERNYPYPPDPSGTFYLTTWHPLNTNSGNGEAWFFGQKCVYAASWYWAHRAVLEFEVPDLEFEEDTAVVRCRYRNSAPEGPPWWNAFNGELREATTFPANAADWASYGDLIESWAVPTSPVPDTREHSITLPAPGTKRFFWIGENERLNTGGGTQSNHLGGVIRGYEVYLKLYTPTPPEE